jgi:hypothetical protein
MSATELAGGEAIVQNPYEAIRSRMLKNANGKHPGGRPTKRTAKITEQICEGISYGLTDEEVAALVGIDDYTLTRWKKDPEFCGAIKKAQATRLLIRLKRIEKGEPGWQEPPGQWKGNIPSALALPKYSCAGRPLTSPACRLGK